MAEEFVNRTEFNLLKDEVNEIKKDMVESQIDKGGLKQRR